MADLTPGPSAPVIGDPNFSTDASNYLGWLVGTFVPEMNTLVSLGGITQTVQSNTSDSTAGRLAIVGAFGLGGNALLIGNAAVTDGSLPTGHYRYDTTASSSGGPTGATVGALLHHRNSATLGEVQEFTVVTGTGSAVAGTRWERHRTSGAWSSWALINGGSSGSNANGRYWQAPNGLLVCTQTLSSPGVASAVWTYPAAFSAAPAVSGMLYRASGGTDAVVTMASTPTTTAVTWAAYALGGAGTTAATTITLTAIGPA